MHMDSQSAIVQVEGEASSREAKYFDVRIKFLNELHKRGIVQPKYEQSSGMLADIFTEVLKASGLDEKRRLVRRE